MSSHRIKRIPPSHGKYLRAHESISPPTNTLHPAFCFRYLDTSTFPESKQHKVAVANTLYKLGRLTWGQIQLSGRKSCGHETINLDSSRVSVPESVTPDTNILSFHCTANGRMIGYRVNKVFYICWFDWSPFRIYSH